MMPSFTKSVSIPAKLGDDAAIRGRSRLGSKTSPRRRRQEVSVPSSPLPDNVAPAAKARQVAVIDIGTAKVFRMAIGEIAGDGSVRTLETL